MKLNQILMLAVIIGTVVLYWLLKKGQFRSDGLDRQLGLENGESIIKMWHGEKDWRFLGQGTAFWGGSIGIQSLIIAITDHDRLIIGNTSSSEEPLIWSRGDPFDVKIIKRGEGELMGPEAREPADIIDINQYDGTTMRFRVPHSAVSMLMDFKQN